MDTLEAIGRRDAAAAMGNEMMVFDWDTAARLIKKYGVTYAALGLAEDIDWTCGDLYRNGKPVDKKSSSAYYVSVWATPVMYLDMKIQDVLPEDEDRITTDEYGHWALECYVPQSERPDWDGYTWWPHSALEILKDKEV